MQDVHYTQQRHLMALRGYFKPNSIEQSVSYLSNSEKTRESLLFFILHIKQTDNARTIIGDGFYRSYV